MVRVIASKGWKIGHRNILLLLCFVLFMLALYLSPRLNNFKLLSRRNCTYDELIDVVYTWVNGSDPEFIKNMNLYLPSSQNIDASKQRYEDKNELRFSLRSLEKFAPWVNHVYLVTNGQIPYWLDLDCEKITVITHEMIFRDLANLPTFSSPAIESNLHRIPGLSSKFIYFNDDIFLGQPLYLDDFYTSSKGYSIFMAYSLADCAVNCPWLYVGDGQCDFNCNNEGCQFDGGDCENQKSSEIKSDEEIDLIESTEFHNNEINNELNSLKEKAYFLLQQISSFHQTTSPKSPTGSQTNKTALLSRLVRDHNKKVIIRNKILKRKKRTLLKGKIDVVQNIDGFSESLMYTQRVFNSKYSFKPRYVPAHAPIFLEKDVMQGMEKTFSTEFKRTERNRFRRKDDMQFGFSYYYFLISETLKKSAEDIFDRFDTDGSGTWSDREIRNLLTKIYDLPLSYEIVDHFDGILLNCSEFRKYPEVETPPNERYLDSKLPTISKEIIVNCPFLSEFLKKKFGRIPKYKYQIIKESETRYATFKMLVSNVSKVVMYLDEIRQQPRKFICLNDNLDESKDSENELVRAILYDFYLSLFPHASQFELPEHSRNRFLHMEELRDWKRRHVIVKTFLLIAIASLIVITFFGALKKWFCKLFSDLFC